MRTSTKALAYLTSLVLVASVVVGLGAGAAYGDPVKDADAAAYGVQLGGPVPLSARPTAAASAPNGAQEACVLDIAQPPAITSGTACAEAQAEIESTLNATLQATMDARRPGLPNKWNARGYAITEDLLAGNDQVGADVIESESTAACVGGKIVFGSATRLVNLTVGGTAVGVLNPTPNQVVFDQAGIRIVAWETNWDPATGGTTDGAAKVFTNALHITGPAGIDLIVSHSEASAVCAAGGARPTPDPTPEPPDEPTPPDEPDDDDEPDQAPPAQPAEGEPNFTG